MSFYFCDLTVGEAVQLQLARKVVFYCIVFSLRGNVVQGSENTRKIASGGIEIKVARNNFFNRTFIVVVIGKNVENTL